MIDERKIQRLANKLCTEEQAMCRYTAMLIARATLEKEETDREVTSNGSIKDQRFNNVGNR